MRTRFFVAVLAMASLPFVTTSAREPAPLRFVAENAGRPLAEAGRFPGAVETSTQATLLGHWTFEDGAGGPDMQGWTPWDRTAQKDVFFHVDDFAGLNPSQFHPLEGIRSMWCGARPCGTEDICYYVALPGYGNNWRQELKSVDIDVTGDVEFKFLAEYWSEPSYDITFVEYSTGGGPWQELHQFSGSWADDWLTTVIPAANHGGDIKFRLRFESDGAWSDEDGLWNTTGAIWVDALTVTDATGVVEYQDFENEPLGSHATLDTHWQARALYEYGSCAALFDGATVLQEDPNVANSSHVWGFFNGSTDMDVCGNHPAQQVVPFSRVVDGRNVYMRSAIRSPEIDVAGVTGDDLILFFDAYMDLPQDNLVYMEVLVRSLVGGAWTKWRNSGVYLVGEQKEWRQIERNLTTDIDPAASSIQMAIGAFDVCEFLCGSQGSGNCHTQAPLIDNVRLWSLPAGVTGIDDARGMALALHTNVPNPFNPATSIAYDVPENGTPVSLRIYDVSGRLVRTLADGAHQAGTHRATWDGRNDAGEAVASGVYFCRMQAGSFSDTQRMVLLK